MGACRVNGALGAGLLRAWARPARRSRSCELSRAPDGQAIQGQPLGSGGRGEPVAVGVRRRPAEGAPDGGEPRTDLRLVPTETLVARQMDHPAGVDHVVGRVQDVGFAQPAASARCRADCWRRRPRRRTARAGSCARTGCPHPHTARTRRTVYRDSLTSITSPVAAAAACARSRSTSDTTSWHPLAQQTGQPPPHRADPLDEHRAADRSSNRKHVARVAAMPWNTPSAVPGAGSPDPPRSRDRPNTCGCRSPTTSMSAWPCSCRRPSRRCRPASRPGPRTAAASSAAHPNPEAAPGGPRAPPSLLRRQVGDGLLQRHRARQSQRISNASSAES